MLNILCSHFLFRETVFGIEVNYFILNVQLVRQLQGQEENPFGDDTATSPKKIFQLLNQTIEALSIIPAPELALRLYLQSAEAANDCELEPVVYEFFTQAYIL
ncbi:vacuolar protein sorting-associated protein 35C-like [Humulus lupulus]|uniref:vacuolar protein sorting-associated protein 35C-like n=1 Tax=Humulus lupulus TaxID=3486 RepID=UPI002B4067BB|nr:vacuolar protein sorting-associated protein 35C-like [Humulus lupulus]